MVSLLTLWAAEIWAVLPLDIWGVRTFVGRIVHPGFEISGFLDQTRCNIRVRDRPGEFEKRCCLTCQILSAHHFYCLRFGSVRLARKRYAAAHYSFRPALQSEH